MRLIVSAVALAAFLCVSAAPAAAQLGIGYSTFFGGSAWDYCRYVAIGERGSVYVAGASVEGPWLPDAYRFMDPDYDYANPTLFVSRYDSSGERLWTTFLGARIACDSVSGIATEGDFVYITGTTERPDVFPATVEYPEYAASGCFVVKLWATNGRPMSSIFLTNRSGNVCGSVGTSGIAVHDGFVYLAGGVGDDTLAVPGATQPHNAGGADAFVMKLARDAVTPIWATYLGGSGNDSAVGIAVDSKGNPYVTGSTESDDFPVTKGAFLERRIGKTDAFVAKYLESGTQTYSTYLTSGEGEAYGKIEEWASGIDLDAEGSAYVAVTYGYATLLSSYEGDPCDIFVAKVAPDGGSLNYRKCLRGSAGDEAFDIAVDPAGCAYVTGVTRSRDFDNYTGLGEDEVRSERGAVNPYEMRYEDAFAAKISRDGRCIEYSTRIGTESRDYGMGIAVGGDGNAVVSGATESGAFFVSPDASQENYGGGGDGYLMDIFFLSAPCYCVRSSSLRVGDRFSVEARVNRNVKGPLDAFAIVATNPTGGERMLGSFMLNGEIREGIFALAQNLPGIQAPLSAVLIPEITIRENFVGSHTFYVVTTNPGIVPAGGMQMSADEFENLMTEKLDDLKKNVVKTVNFHKWVVEPPNLSKFRLPTAEEWDELTH